MIQKKYKLLNSRGYKQTRRILRANQTQGERIVWGMVRNNHLGYKFRRQYGIGKYVADFCCPELKLIIEIDGESHDSAERIAHDAKREQYLSSVGFTVKRYNNNDIVDNPEGFYISIREVCVSISHTNPHPNPLP